MKKLKTLSLFNCVFYPAVSTVMIFFFCMIYFIVINPHSQLKPGEILNLIYGLLSFPFMVVHFFFIDTHPFSWDLANQNNPSLKNVENIAFFSVWWSFLSYGSTFFMFYTTLFLTVTSANNSKKLLFFLWVLYIVFVWTLSASKQFS